MSYQNLSWDKKNTFYTEDEINSMNVEINSILNEQGYVYEDNGNLYNVFFDLDFVDGGESWNAEYLFDTDPLGNLFYRMPEKLASTIFKTEDNGNGTVTHVGGVCQDDKVIMNADYGDNNRNRIHEIFHTLYFNNDGAESGIGNYVPGTDLPNQADINKLLNNPSLKLIEE